jgi:tetratricopeptide (TPR) repeat protein
MHSDKRWSIPVRRLLLLLCALNIAPRAAAQKSCKITFTCPSAGGGCASAMGGQVTTTGSFNFASTADCNTRARNANPNIGGVGISCACTPPDGAPTGGSTTAAPAAQTPLQQQELRLAQQLGQQLGYAVGQQLHNWLFGSPPNVPQPQPAQDPAEQQQALAAQQLNNSGVYLLKQKNYAGALNEFQQALAQTPNDASIRRNLEIAQQKLKDHAVAGQTSGALSQLLGAAPAGMGNSDTALNLVNVDSDQNAVDLRGTTGTSPESLKGQLDNVFSNSSPTSAPSDALAVQPQARAQDVDQLFQPSPSNPSQPAPSPSQLDAEQKQVEQKQVEDIFKDPGGTTDSAALAQQARVGQMATAAKSDEDASGLARQGFDTAAPNVVVTQTRAAQAPATASPASISPTVVDLSQSTRPLVPENLKTPQIALNAAPEAAKFPITVMRSAGSGGFTAPGAPIFDCEGDRTIINRLAAGVPVQEEAIRRTAAAMAAANAAGDEPRKQAMFAAISTLLSSATTASNWAETVIAKVEGLKSAGIRPETAAQFKLLQNMKETLEVSNKLVGLAANARKYYLAGHAFGDAVLVQETAKTLVDRLEAAKKLLVDSDLFSQVGEEAAAKIAFYGFGPVGGLTMEALVHTIASGIDLYMDGQQAWNSAREAEQAERDLTVMRYQQMLVRDRIYELQQEVAVGCSNMKADR